MSRGNYGVGQQEIKVKVIWEQIIFLNENYVSVRDPATSLSNITLAEYKIKSSLSSLSEWLLPYDARFSAARGSAWQNSALNIVAQKISNKIKMKRASEEWVGFRPEISKWTYLRACSDDEQIFWWIRINIFHFHLQSRQKNGQLRLLCTI